MTRPPAGFCLTFDDLFVDNWCAAAPIFAEFGAKVTFCVSHIHTANPAQVDGLRALQNAGHEIGFHTRTHPKLSAYLAKHGLEIWLAEEIDAGIAEHRALGFPATSYAAPFHATTKETRRGTGERFDVIRARGFRSAAKDLNARIYNRLRADKVVDNIGSINFQHPVQGGWTWLGTLLDTIFAQGGVSVFTGHDIRARKGNRGTTAAKPS